MSSEYEGIAEFMKDRLEHSAFYYTKKNGRTIAPCGSARRCKNHHRKCECWEEAGMCDRADTIPEKVDQRLFAESILHGWKKRPRRLNQLKKAWTLEYRLKRKHVLKYCGSCLEEYCSKNDIKNPNCKLIFEGAAENK